MLPLLMLASLPPRARPWLDLAAATAVLAALTLVALPGLPFHFGSGIGPDLGDPLLNLVFLEWGAHQAGLGFPDLWNAFYFYPAKMTLALSDHLVGPAVLRFALGELGLDPAASYNLLLFLSFVATGLAVAALARRAGLSRSAALFAACAYTFSHFRFFHLSHFQLLWAPFLPLALGTFDRLLERPSPPRAIRFLACYALHLTGGTYLAYMIHVPLAAIVAARTRSLRAAIRAGAAGIAVLAGTAALSLLAAWFVFTPYLRAGESYHLERNEGWFIGLGATLLSFVTPDSASRLAPALAVVPVRSENVLFPGLVAGGLLAAAALRAGRRASLPRSAWRRSLLAVGVVLVLAAVALGDYRTWTRTDRLELGVVSLSLRHYEKPFRGLVAGLALAAVALNRPGKRGRRSPAAGLRRSLCWASWLAFLFCFPIVYAPLAERIPGLEAMRVPTRFFAFAGLGIAIAAAASLDRLRRRFHGWRRQALVLAAVALTVAETAPRPYLWSELEPPDRFPPVYRDIARRESVRAVIELPLPDSRDCFVDTVRMYYATAHWKPIANGCSGYFPASYEELRAELVHPPRRADLARLRRLGVSHVLFREDAPQGPRWALLAWSAKMTKAREGKLVYRDDRSLLFELTDEVPRPSRTRGAGKRTLRP